MRRSLPDINEEENDSEQSAEKQSEQLEDQEVIHLNQVMLHISCKKLKNTDGYIGGKTDPFIKVYMKEVNQEGEDDDGAEAGGVVQQLMLDGRKGYHKIGQTEVQQENFNPVFETPIKVTYLFEKQQKLRFELYDQDGTGRLGREEYIGYHEELLGHIMRKSRGKGYSDYFVEPGASRDKSEVKDDKDESIGKIIIRAESQTDGNNMMEIKVSASLDSLRGWWCGDRDAPYLVIKRAFLPRDIKEDVKTWIW